MKYILFALISFSNVIIPSKLCSQELNIQETLDYINEKLNIDGNKNYEKYDSYEWSITKDGKIIIKRFHYKVLNQETSFYLKQLDPSFVGTYKEKDNPQFAELTVGLIKIYTKKDGITDRYFGVNDKGYYDDKAGETISHFFMTCLSFNQDELLTNQLKNAIDHLIILGKAKKEFREKDPFDN